jgi:riboflavin kinase/FMN adenylyltransferase
MRIIEWPQFLKNGLDTEKKLSSVTIGIFDGVHLGHRALIDRIVSHDANYIPVVITFRGGIQNPIQTFDQKIEMLDKLGVQIALVIDFTDKFKRIKGPEFLQILLERASLGFLAVGSNFHCGYQKDTDAKAIQSFFAAHAVPVEIVPNFLYRSQPVSSSRIRTALADGNVSEAQAMLGYVI